MAKKPKDPATPTPFSCTLLALIERGRVTIRRGTKTSQAADLELNWNKETRKTEYTIVS